MQGKLRVQLSNTSGASTVLQEVGPGGVAGFLTVLAGYPLFTEISCATDVRVALLPKAAFDRLVDNYPYVWFALAKRWTAQLSPLVRQVDYALDWVHMDAAQVLSRPGEPSKAIYFVLNGRLRMIAKSDGKRPGEMYVRRSGCAAASARPQTATSDGAARCMLGLAAWERTIVGEFGRGEAVGDLELLTDTPLEHTVHAVRDTEVARIPFQLFNVLAAHYPQVRLSCVAHTRGPSGHPHARTQHRRCAHCRARRGGDPVAGAPRGPS